MFDIEKIWNKYSSSVISNFYFNDRNFIKGIIIEYGRECPEFLEMNTECDIIENKKFYEICDKIVYDVTINNTDYSEQYHTLKNTKPQIRDLIDLVEDSLLNEWVFRNESSLSKEVIDNFEKKHPPLLNLHKLTTQLWEKEKFVLLHWSGSASSDAWYKLFNKYDRYIDAGAKCILTWWLDGMIYEENIKLVIIGICPENKKLDDSNSKRVILGHMCLKVVPILDECNIRHEYVKWGDDVYVSIILDAL